MALHPVRIALYAALALSSIILLGLTAGRIQHTRNLGFHDPVVVELLVTSIFGFIWSLCLMFAIHRRAERGVLSSYASEIGGLFVLWLMFLVGTAIVTNDLAQAASFCDRDKQCQLLNAIIAFGWISWIITTFLLVASVISVMFNHSRLDSPLHGQGTGPMTRNVGHVTPVSAAV